MVGRKQVLDAAKVVVQYCCQQSSCQNCIFRQYGADHWECNIRAFDLREVLSNAEAKAKNHGYI